jgi:hypothetical protein
VLSVAADTFGCKWEEGISMGRTLNELALETVQDIRTQIAPGASGWTKHSEEMGLENLIQNSMVNVTVPEDSQLIVRNDIFTRLRAEVNPTPESDWSLEDGMNPGQLNSNLITVEADLQAQVDADQDT